jgi:hypothetical protein
LLAELAEQKALAGKYKQEYEQATQRQVLEPPAMDFML